MSSGKNISGNVFDMRLMKRVLTLAGPHRSLFFTSCFLAVALAVIGPLKALLTQKAIDDYILVFDQPGLTRISILILGLIVFESSLRYFFVYLSSVLGQSIIHELRIRVYQHALHLKMRFFDRTPIGTATTRTINDVEAINQIFSQGLITIIAELLTIITIVVVMFYVNWKLALICLSTMPLFILTTYIFKEGIKKAFNQVRTQVSRLNAFLQERISGMRIVQIFTAEEREMRKFQAINEDHKQAHIQAIWYYSVFFPLIELIMALTIGLIVFGFAWIITDQPDMNVGVLIAFIMLVSMLFRPLRFLADRFNTLQMGLVAADRVFDLLDTEENIQDSGKQSAEEIQGKIEFSNVRFSYNEGEPVLKNLNFTIEPGETVAIVGSTGSGKTTIINVLGRFYPLDSGKVVIDGTDATHYDLSSLRSQMSVVLQDVFLFSGTVMDNINLRNENIEPPAVIRAAKALGAHDFIMKLPKQYNFKVMERGATLSMGQRQLISFVRAMVFDPKILILDEATSSIDTESEHLIQQAITKLVAGRTSLVIAHRLSTIRNADKIIVLDQGELIEMGTHEELLAADGHYKNLHDLQFSVNESIN